MSKLSKAVAKQHEKNVLRMDEVVTNFMGGDSYKVNPLDTLKLVSASSVFGEASYYRKDVKDGHFSWESKFSDSISKLILSKFDGKTTTEIFTESIDNALDYDFAGTLEFAKELRTVYNMRLNPQIIMVRAAIHPKRDEFTKANPGKFSEIEQVVMSRADEPMSQLAYYMFINNGNKNKLPTILKKSIAKKLSSLKRYAVNKYKNHEIGMINAVRITHANSPVLDELMKTGTIAAPEDEKIWEQKRSAGASWREILEDNIFGHMALLRNLRNIFIEVDDSELCKLALTKLKDGVKEGKQFPFRYLNAYNRIKSDSNVHHLPLILDALEECIDISIDNLPKFTGKIMCLSDNSGSAWGTIPTEYGTVTVAEIDNLSSVILAKCSEEGYVGKFGDKLVVYPITKRSGALDTANKISSTKMSNVGGATEGGIWKFFKQAIDNKEHWDNIVIFSDMQCGTGGLYGTYEDKQDYYNRGYSINGYVNVFKLIQDYRKHVYKDVNVYCVQTAGYDNTLVPQMSYRTAMLTGWTGKEALFMKAYSDQWDNIVESQFSFSETFNLFG